MSTRGASRNWDEYLAGFHQDRPGITERILSRSVDSHGATPYEWVTESIPDEGLVVDVACGSAPLWSPQLAGRYLGIDVSDAELELARRRGAHPVARGSAEDLPVDDGAAAAVVCTMALMLLPDLPAALREVRRVLSPNGILIATVPVNPTAAKDLVFGAGLLHAAGGSFGYRNDAVLRRARQLFADQGLKIIDDTRCTYRFDLTADDAADDAAASLYLRGHQAARERKVARYLRRAARRGRSMPVPIRRILARVADGSR